MQSPQVLVKHATPEHMKKQIYPTDARMDQYILISKYMTCQQNEEQIQSSQFI